MISSGLTLPLADSSTSTNTREVKAQAGGHEEVSAGLTDPSASQEIFSISFHRFLPLAAGPADVWTFTYGASVRSHARNRPGFRPDES